MTDTSLSTNQIPLTKPMQLSYGLTLIGYFGLILLIPIWNLWWFPSERQSFNITLTVLWLIPLVFPMIGLIKKNPYTFSWSGFIAALYLCHALTCLITNKDETFPTLLELLLASLFFFGSMYFSRWRTQQISSMIAKVQGE
jgi:uncharacterized membrane protein